MFNFFYITAFLFFSFITAKSSELDSAEHYKIFNKFAPYLKSSMYYAKPESPLRDEMLMNNLAGSSSNKGDYTKAELPARHEGANIETRITAAPFGAQTLFRTIKENSNGAVGRLIQYYNETPEGVPPLSMLYEAYYDELYRRTKCDGYYRVDENILMRDALGNLVRTLNRGTQEEKVEIVYYQAEFQVFEKVFTDLMRKECEEQRGA